LLALPADAATVEVKVGHRLGCSLFERPAGLTIAKGRTPSLVNNKLAPP